MQDPLARPRVTLGAALTLGSFALLAPAMVFPALALLCLTSPPARTSVRFLLGLGTLYAVLWLLAPGGLADQTVRAWLVIGALLFVGLARGGRVAPLDAALVAVLVAAVAVLAWLAVYRVAPSAPVREVQRELHAAYQQIGDLSRLERDEVNRASALADAVFIPALPAIMMLIGLSGLLTAWRWYHMLAAAPVGAPPAPFREFSFSDHVVWLLVAGLAGVVAQLQGSLTDGALWPANLLLFSGVLYVARGAAVIRWRTGQWSGPVLLVAVIAVLFLWPFVGTALFGIGLADTWLDFRRPPAPAPGE